MGDPRSSVETNALLTVCATRYCRPVLAHFRDSASDIALVTELVDEIASESPDERERVAIQLRHSVLPRLNEIGYLDYDERSETVRYRGHVELEALAVAIANR